MSDSMLGIIIIIAIIIIGFATGGAIFQGPGFGQSVLSDSKGKSLGEILNNPPPYGEKQNVAFELNQIGQEIQGISETLEQIGGANASVHFGKVTISGIPNRGSLSEYVSLRSSQADIPITGWRIRSVVTGSVITIGGASKIASLSVKNEEPVFTKKGGEYHVNAGFSPLAGSFQVNKCMQYLEQKKTFAPRLNVWQCPSPSKELPPISNQYNDACIDYISGLNTCRTPKESEYPDNIKNSCKQYIKAHYNYENCVANHKNDPDFYISDWRFYSNKPLLLWRTGRERIQLLDTSGKIVNEVVFE